MEEAFTVFVSLSNELGLYTNEQYGILKEETVWLSRLCTSVHKSHKTVFIKVEDHQLPLILERIRRRAGSGDPTVSLNYLQQINNNYKRYFDDVGSKQEIFVVNAGLTAQPDVINEIFNFCLK